METWIVIADETQASLVVRSAYGPFHEIEKWKRTSHSPENFTQQIADRLRELQSHFDDLVVAAPPKVLERLCRALPSVKVAAQYPRYLTHLSQRELGQELRQLCSA